jgi:hypothetical protein
MGRAVVFLGGGLVVAYALRVAARCNWRNARADAVTPCIMADVRPPYRTAGWPRANPKTKPNSTVFSALSIRPFSIAGFNPRAVAEILGTTPNPAARAAPVQEPSRLRAWRRGQFARSLKWLSPEQDRDECATRCRSIVPNSSATGLRSSPKQHIPNGTSIALLSFRNAAPASSSKERFFT